MDKAAQTLNERLERLERENSRIKRSARLMKIAMALSLVLCVATFSIPGATGAPALKVLSAQQINLVNAGGRVLASLAPTSDGNVLTFFDSVGRKTMTCGDNANESFAGCVTWDNNNVIPGNGIVRTTFGESNPNLGPISGFGVSVLDGTGKVRTGFGTTYDLASNDIFAVDSDGSSTGIGVFHATKFTGFFTNDSNGVTREFGGLSFDAAISEDINEIALLDPTVRFASQPHRCPPILLTRRITAAMPSCFGIQTESSRRQWPPWTTAHSQASTPSTRIMSSATRHSLLPKME